MREKPAKMRQKRHAGPAAAILKEIAGFDLVFFACSVPHDPHLSPNCVRRYIQLQGKWLWNKAQ
jgi:hypothetical protein